jgi:hypothetical protein
MLALLRTTVCSLVGVIGGPAGMATRGEIVPTTPVLPREGISYFGEKVAGVFDGHILARLDALLVVLETHGSLLVGEAHLAN